MRAPTEEEIHIKSRLLYLFNETYKNEVNWHTKLVKQYIYVGEWQLAADRLAFECLPGKLTLTATNLKIFSDLAERMDLLKTEWLDSIKALLSSHPLERTPE